MPVDAETAPDPVTVITDLPAAGAWAGALINPGLLYLTALAYGPTVTVNPPPPLYIPAPIPTTDLVAPAWVATIAGLTADGVGTQLPPDDRTWAANGYILVPATVGGTPHSSGPVRRPVCQVECWATTPGSSRPPWQKAAQLAEQIRLATYDRRNFGRALPITLNGVTFAGARVLGAMMLTEPRRVWGDVADYGAYIFDLQLDWIAAGEVLA